MFTLTEQNTILTKAHYAEGLSEYKIPASVNSIADGNENDFALKELQSKVFFVSFEKESKIKTIGQYSFYQCIKLQNISFENANSLEIISPYAFFQCYSLREVIFPDSLRFINGYGDFKGCPLTKAVFSENSCLEFLEAGTFGDTQLETFFIPKNCKSHQAIGETFFRAPIREFQVHPENKYFTVVNGSLFSYNKTILYSHQKFAPLTIPEETTTIGFLSLSGYKYPLSIPKHITVFDRLPFYFYAGTSIAIHSEYTIIAERAFQYCSNLIEVKFYDKVSTISSTAFDQCNKLQRVMFSVLPDKITSNAFPPSRIPFICFYGEVEGIDKLFPTDFIHICSCDGKTYIPLYNFHTMKQYFFIFLLFQSF